MSIKSDQVIDLKPHAHAVHEVQICLRHTQYRTPSIMATGPCQGTGWHTAGSRVDITTIGSSQMAHQSWWSA